ncbi:MAG TPA: hypothetical protein VJ454_10105, partial [Steroidobacteraceae bacterium]|nr:hypothetical protein [Steroidobacteraceae bacterium]
MKVGMVALHVFAHDVLTHGTCPRHERGYGFACAGAHDRAVANADRTGKKTTSVSLSASPADGIGAADTNQDLGTSGWQLADQPDDTTSTGLSEGQLRGEGAHPADRSDVLHQQLEPSVHEHIAATHKDALGFFSLNHRRDETQEFLPHARAIECPRRIAGSMRHQPL